MTTGQAHVELAKNRDAELYARSPAITLAFAAGAGQALCLVITGVVRGGADIGPVFILLAAPFQYTCYANRAGGQVEQLATDGQVDLRAL